MTNPGSYKSWIALNNGSNMYLLNCILGATVSVVVMDKDSFGSDDFMGQVVLNLSDFADGKEHSVFEQLRDEVYLQELTIG